MSETNNTDKFTIDPTGQKKVILSIDGGGMRGAISVAMLAELEKRTGKSCHEIFDMFVGTSTGAIIAAGLAMGFSAEFILENVYKEHLPAAFNQAHGPWLKRLAAIFVVLIIISETIAYFVDNNIIQVAAWTLLTICLLLLAICLYLMVFAKSGMMNLIARVISNGLKYAYDVEPIKKSLIELAGQKKLIKVGDIEDKILLTTTKNLETGETAFVVNRGAGAHKFEHWSIVDAVAASSSAPVFFAPHKNRFVDGGVSPFGNPCFVAAVEAIEYIRGDYQAENIILVSIGTGYPPDNIESESAVVKKRFLDWLLYVTADGIDDAVNQQVYITRRLYSSKYIKPEERMDFRRYNPSLNQAIVEDLLGRSLNINPADLGLDSFREKEVALMVEIGRAYASEIDWSLQGAITWEANFKGGQPDPSDDRTNNIDW